MEVNTIFIWRHIQCQHATYGTYIFEALLVSATEIGQFYIMLVETMILKLFTICSPTLLYILLTNVSLSIYLIVSPTIFYYTVVNIFEFSAVYVVLKTYRPCLFILNLTIPLLVWALRSSCWRESYMTLFFLTKLVSENIFSMDLSSYHTVT